MVRPFYITAVPMVVGCPSLAMLIFLSNALALTNGIFTYRVDKFEVDEKLQYKYSIQVQYAVPLLSIREVQQHHHRMYRHLVKY